MSASARLRRHIATLIAVWPGDDYACPQYDGLPIMVPPRSVVAEPEDKADPKTKGSIFRFPAALDAAGRPIPGTVVLTTEIRPDPSTGGVRVDFDALAWADGVETTDANKGLIARGLKIVDSVDEVAAAMAAGREKWEAGKEREWMTVLDNEQKRRDELKAKGMRDHGCPNPALVRAAHGGLMGLRRSRTERDVQITDDELMAAISGAPAPVLRAVPSPEPVRTPQEPKAEDTVAEVADLCLKAAVMCDVDLTKAQFTGLVKHDEAIVQQVMEKLVKAGVDYMNPQPKGVPSLETV